VSNGERGRHPNGCVAVGVAGIEAAVSNVCLMILGRVRQAAAARVVAALALVAGVPLAAGVSASPSPGSALADPTYPARCGGSLVGAAGGPAPVADGLRGRSTPEFTARPSDLWSDLNGDGVDDLLSTQWDRDAERERLVGSDGRSRRQAFVYDVDRTTYRGPAPARVGLDARPGLVLQPREHHFPADDPRSASCEAGSLEAVDGSGKLVWRLVLGGSGVTLPSYPGRVGAAAFVADYALLDGGPGKATHVAAYTPGVSRPITLIDGASGAVKSIVPTLQPDGVPVDGVAGVRPLPDIDGDGRQEFEVLAFVNGKPSLFDVRNGATGVPLWKFVEHDFVVTGARSLGDLNGDGINELALRRRIGQGWTAHDGTDGAPLWHVDGTSIFGTTDVDQDGVSDPVTVSFLDDGVRYRRHSPAGAIITQVDVPSFLVGEGRDIGVRAIGDVDGDGVEDYYHRSYYNGDSSLDAVVSGKTLTVLWSPDGARIVMDAVPGLSPVFLTIDRPAFEAPIVTALDGRGRPMWSTTGYRNLTHGRAVGGGPAAQDVVFMNRELIGRHAGRDGSTFWAENGYQDFVHDDCIWCQ
jgi:hypothetical protein